MRRIRQIFVGLCVLILVLVFLGKFIPVPSTLMLGRWISGQNVTRIWKPMESFPKALRHGLLASEDQRFCQHYGVDFDVLRELLNDEDAPRRGGSTITMQTVKNAYLWPGRSYLRKAIEIPIALLVDLIWGKRRVVEVYLNFAEWGDGIYGVEAASRHYFKKGVEALSSAESARLIAALPNPALRKPWASSVSSRRVLGQLDDVSGLTRCID